MITLITLFELTYLLLIFDYYNQKAIYEEKKVRFDYISIRGLLPHFIIFMGSIINIIFLCALFINFLP